MVSDFFKYDGSIKIQGRLQGQVWVSGWMVILFLERGREGENGLLMLLNRSGVQLLIVKHRHKTNVGGEGKGLYQDAALFRGREHSLTPGQSHTDKTQPPPPTRNSLLKSCSILICRLRLLSRWLSGFSLSLESAHVGLVPPSPCCGFPLWGPGAAVNCCSQSCRHSVRRAQGCLSP